MIIRAYVRHLVAPIGTQIIGECKSVFICGNPIGGNLRHYVPTRSFGIIPGSYPPLCIDGIAPNYIRRGLRLPICMATLFRNYIRRGVLKLLCWRSSTEFIYIRHIVYTTSYTPTRRHLPLSYTTLLRSLSRPHTPILRSHSAINPYLHE